MARQRTETPDERLRRELDDLYTKRDALDDEIAEAEAELAQYEDPFVVGDIVKANGQRAKVVEVAPAFGSFAVRVVFVDNKNKPKDGKAHLFDASDLALLEG